MINLSSNAAPMSASLTLARTNQNLKQSITRLSSGLRINSSFDDPEGVAVSARFNNKVLQSSALGQNLGNTLSFLETQEAYLKRVGSILTRIQELEIQKQDVIKTQGDISIYDTEKSNLIAEIYQIRDERFNGVRLFSPDSDMDSMDADTQAINNASEVVQQPPLVFKGANKPVEIVFVVDTTASMGPTKTALQNNINAFASSLDNKVAEGLIPSWSARVVGFKDLTADASPLSTSTAFTNDVTALAAQLSALGISGGGDLPESMIDGIAASLNTSGWSANTSVTRGMIVFTDAASKAPVPASGTIASIAQQVKDNSVNLTIYGQPSDSNTQDFANQSGANLYSYNSMGNVGDRLNDFIGSVLTEEIIDFDTLAQYIALNGAKQNRIRNLIDSNALLKNHATESLGEIRDLDVAAESVNFSRLKLLQDAGTAYIAQSNVAMNSSLFNLIL